MITLEEPRLQRGKFRSQVSMILMAEITQCELHAGFGKFDEKCR